MFYQATIQQQINDCFKVDALALLPSSTSLGIYKELNQRDEERRNLSTNVSADLVVTQGPGNPAKVCILHISKVAKMLTFLLERLT